MVTFSIPENPYGMKIRGKAQNDVVVPVSGIQLYPKNSKKTISITISPSEKVVFDQNKNR